MAKCAMLWEKEEKWVAVCEGTILIMFLENFLTTKLCPGGLTRIVAYRSKADI